jgi:hypothetical protein
VDTIYELAMAGQFRRSRKALSIGPSPQKQQEAAGTPPRFWCFFFSFYEVMTNDDQQRIIRYINTTQRLSVKTSISKAQ